MKLPNFWNIIGLFDRRLLGSLFLRNVFIVNVTALQKRWEILLVGEETL